MLRPTFTLTIGALQASSTKPTGGPRALVVERDMDVPADALWLRLMDASGVSLGDNVAVQLGYDGAEEKVFTGKVVALLPALDGAAITALGMMNDLLNLRTAATFDNQAAGSIARDLIGRAGLAAGTVDDGPVLPRYAVDSRLSGFGHLKELADRLGYELYTNRDGEVMFHALGPGAGLDSAVGGLGAAGGLLGGGGGETYKFGSHLLAASADRAPAAWGTVVVGGESPMSGSGDTTAHWLTVKDADYRGSAGSGDPVRLIFDPAARTKDLADRFAAGHLATATRRSQSLRVRVPGRSQVDLGDTLTVSGSPDARVTGTGYVRAIRHRFDVTAGFVTDFRLSVSA